MTTIPQVNATLVSVNTSGYSEDYDTGAGSTSAKWQGNSGIYVSDRGRRVLSEGDLTRVRDVVAYLDADLAVQTTVQSGDYITYQQGSVTRTGRIQDVTVATLPGATHYMRLPLEEVVDA